MDHQCVVAQRLAGDPLYQFRGRKALALGMDFFAQPVTKRLEFAGGELRCQAAQIGVGGAKNCDA